MTENQLITFEHKDIGEIRGFIKDGEPWFLAGNVCRCLGIKNSRDAVASVDKRYEIAGIKGVGSSYTLLDTAGGKQKVLVIPEPHLYELIFQSRKQKAIIFRSWVTTEVLPSLRRHGEYRLEGKMIRRSLTDTIIESGEQERMHGQGIPNFTKLINKSVGLPPKNNRDELADDVLKKIADREDTVRALLREGKTYPFIKEFLEKL